jgi:alkylation response protein AidB-like acyl-CoA dehydrogenase
MSAIAFELDDDIQQIREGIIAFAKSEVLPRHAQNRELLEDARRKYDEDGRLSAPVRALIREIRMASAEAGYYHMCVPTELGGGGQGMQAYYACWEALFHTCGPQNWMMLYALSHWAFGPSRLLEKMTDQARDTFLIELMSGDKSMCFALSEPGAGSDATMIKTKAVREGDEWVIEGRKIWISNGPIADYCVIFAVTDTERAAARRGGISAFIVPTDAPGFEMQRVVKLFGHIGGDEAELRFEDLRVKDWQLVGDLHEGFSAALYGVSLGRIYNSARAVGLGRWSVELALDYAQTRETFGKKISEYQGVTFPLAKAATELHAAHLMGLNATKLLDQGHPAIKELSMTKAYSVQIGLKAIDRSMQAHGAMGLTNELGLAEAWQYLRIINIADGSNEILNKTIAQRLLKGDTDL